MFVVFLDIDGVLNNSIHKVKSNKHHGYEFDPSCVANLKEILTKTKAKIVLITSWKRGKTIVELKSRVFRHYDLSKYIIGKTPDFHGSTRGEEIFFYLESNNVTNYVILDDDERNIEPLVSKLIFVDSKIGIDDRVKLEAIRRLLNKEDV